MKIKFKYFKSPKVWILLLVFLVLLASPTALSYIRYTAKEDISRKLGASIAECPMGHEISVVPVRYGLQAGGPVLEREIENGDIVIGGCMSGPCDPAYMGLCKTCRYLYDPMDETWSRRSESPVGFAKEFSDVITEFKSPRIITTHCFQEMRDDGFVSQTINYELKPSTVEQYADLRTSIDEYLAERNIAPEIKNHDWKEIEPETPPRCLSYSWEDLEAEYDIWIYWNSANSSTSDSYVRFYFAIAGPESNAPAWSRSKHWLVHHGLLNPGYEKRGNR